LRLLVHFTTDAVAAVFLDDRITILAGMPLDGMPHVAKRGAGTDGLMPFHIAS
jgi:hypothetical protein